MHKRCLVFLLVLVSAVPIFSQASGQKILDDFINDPSPRIRTMLDSFFSPLFQRPGMNEQEFDVTLRSIDSDLKNLPKNAHLWIEKAFILAIQGQSQQAIDAIGEAEKINPNEALLYFVIAFLHQRDVDTVPLRLNLLKAIGLNALPQTFSSKVWGENYATWYKNQKSYGQDEHRYGFTDQFYDFRKSQFVQTPFYESQGLPKFLFSEFEIIDDRYSVDWKQQLSIEGNSLVSYRMVGILPWGTDQWHLIYQVYYK